MSKPGAEGTRGTLTICIEINDVESEALTVTNLNDLNAKLGHFFQYYNLTDPFIQAKIKRRVLASYNRMIKEAALGPVIRETREKKNTTPPPHKQKQVATEQKKQLNSLCLKPKQNVSGFGFKMGFSSAAFLKNLSSLKKVEPDGPEPVRNQRVGKVATSVQNKSQVVERTRLQHDLGGDQIVVYNPSNRYKSRKTVADPGIYSFPNQSLQTPAFGSRQDARVSRGIYDDSRNGFDQGYSSSTAQMEPTKLVPEKRRAEDWINAQFDPPNSAVARKVSSMRDTGQTRSFKDEGNNFGDKTNKKPSIELILDRTKSAWSQQEPQSPGDFYQGNQFYGRHVSIKDPTAANNIREAFRAPPPDPIPLTPREIFDMLDGMRIGLISQKNLKISSLSVSCLKKLQPAIARIYSGDDATCYDLDDFKRLLVLLRIDLSDAF
jgi:hypothetical protein